MIEARSPANKDKVAFQTPEHPEASPRCISPPVRALATQKVF